MGKLHAFLIVCCEEASLSDHPVGLRVEHLEFHQLLEEQEGLLVLLQVEAGHHTQEQDVGVAVLLSQLL